MEKSTPKGEVFIWSEGFPFKFSASNEKNFLLAKALKISGYKVYLVSKIKYKDGSSLSGEIEGVNYLNFHSTKFKNKFANYISSSINELNFILNTKKKNKKTYVLYSYTSFAYLFIYIFYCKLFQIKTILNIMEWHIGVMENANAFKKINAYLFDRFTILLADGAITISDFIKSKLEKSSSKKGIIKIPILTDIYKIDQIQTRNNMQKPYALLCANIGYLSGINLIVDSFKSYINESKNELNLILIINGKLPDQIKWKNENIITLNNIEYNDLIKYYKYAEIVFAPLNNSLQDIARFPQKIAEYCACGKAIISNQVGEVGQNFKHLIDIYFANDFSVETYKKAIYDVLSDKNLKSNLERNSRKNCEINFDYRNYSTKLDVFLSNMFK